MFLEKAHMYPKPINVYHPNLAWGVVSVLYGKTGGKWSSNERGTHFNAKEILSVLNGFT